jgi:hypothetical protein
MKGHGQVDATIEYNVYGQQHDKEKMIIARVLTVVAVRAGFEPIAEFKTNDDGAQYAAYVEQLKSSAARYDMLAEKFREDPKLALMWLERFLKANT